MSNDSRHTNFIRKSKEKRLFGRSRYRWEDNINMDLKVIPYCNVGCVHLVLDRFYKILGIS
jgi:hypothetical protein